MQTPELVPHDDRYDPGRPPEEAARELYEVLSRRRTVREFSDRPVSRETIEWLVRCAASAPSGANLQPWSFVAVQDPELKRRIREAAEAEEREFYTRRAPPEWLEALAPLGTDAEKPFLEIAPWLIVVFRHATRPDGGHSYYSQESVGIAVGMLLAAAQLAGLATLTHTPNPMRFLEKLLQRPAYERAWMLIPVGYPAEGCRVPRAALTRRPLRETLSFDAPSE